jgi:hypothetical protein
MFKDTINLNFCATPKKQEWQWQWHEATDSQWNKMGELIYKAYEKGIILVAVDDSNGKRFKSKRIR